MPTLFYLLANVEPAPATFFRFLPPPPGAGFDDPACYMPPVLPGDDIRVFVATNSAATPPSAETATIVPVGGGPSYSFGTLHKRTSGMGIGLLLGTVPATLPPGVYQFSTPTTGLSNPFLALCDANDTLYVHFEACGNQMNYPYSDYTSVAGPFYYQALRLFAAVRSVSFETNQKVDVLSSGKTRLRYARLQKKVEIKFGDLDREAAEALQCALAHSFFGFGAPAATAVVIGAAGAVGLAPDGPLEIEEASEGPFKTTVHAVAKGKVVAYNMVTAFCDNCLP